MTQSNLFSLFIAADYLQVTFLANECIKIIEKKVLSAENVLKIRQQFEHIDTLVVVIDTWIAITLNLEELKQLKVRFVKSRILFESEWEEHQSMKTLLMSTLLNLMT